MRVFLTLPHDELVRQKPATSKEEQVGSRRTGGAGDEAGLDPVAGRGGDEGGGGGGGGGGLREGEVVRPWAGDGGLVSWHRVKIFADGSLGACVRVCLRCSDSLESVFYLVFYVCFFLPDFFSTEFVIFRSRCFSTRPEFSSFLRARPFFVVVVDV